MIIIKILYVILPRLLFLPVEILDTILIILFIVDIFKYFILLFKYWNIMLSFPTLSNEINLLTNLDECIIVRYALVNRGTLCIPDVLKRFQFDDNLISINK